MNQTTAFNPPLCCKLFDDRLVKFARSDMNHWATLCEEIKAPKSERLRASIGAEEELKPIQRLQLLEDLADMEVTIDEAMRLARSVPKWIKRHLSLAYTEAGGSAAEIDDVLRLIPSTLQADIAHQIAMHPVVKGEEVGTEGNPLVPGTDYAAFKAEAERLAAERANANASTGGASATCCGDAGPASTPAS